MAFPARLLLAFCGASLALANPLQHSASTFAGATSTAVFPPPNATNTAVDTFFPDAAEVGHAGPTPTGDEAFVLETAPAAPVKGDVYPLVNPVEAQTTVKQPSFDIMRSWGNLSPWFSVGDVFGLPDASAAVPSGCELTQVHLLHRHGARYPTSGSGPSAFAAKLHGAATSEGFSASGPLEFLNTWTYKLGAELLTPFGRQQLFELGIAFRVKYGHLLKDFTDLPVFRTTSEARMVDSALHFAAGFFGVQQYQDSYHQLITIEDDGFNNTLAPWSACPNANNAVEDIGFDAAANWTEIYLKKTVPRLQKHLKGVTLDVNDVQAMQDLCAYETVALGFSTFCDLFTEEEWKGYEYAFDLELWYSFGPGNPATAAQGIGYVQQLVSRLTQTPLTNFDTSLNSTLDGNNVTSPLTQPIYVDATHDTVISTILVALNFTTMAANGPLPVDHIPKHQTYTGQHLVPFASNLVGQVMSCPASSKSQDKKSFIRFLLNDGVVPLTGIAHCTADKNGLCELDNFVKGMTERIAEVDFAFDCFANYTAPWPDPIIDGRMHK
ncbi:phosphoglycerate mutase-like protein [Trametes versicolor FP-101664 SS1]|uniref:phosphoglycerate mutase-like protein n=1 Tax=Trametes versicolor (strain FP-101664) TaxID=717944 RepID=UPI0004623627|nr:phosphoglycerate mutase-like protein [Trametes versicolor FP-101664 SS1]EIW64306.1 phosphoglycerate mutase-like protein [Trametes versicolor FP-101664 SS1]